MQLLSCDLWLMERNAMRNFAALAAAFGSPDSEKARATTNSGTPATRQKAIAIVPISGALEARPTELGQWLGMSSYEAIGAVFDQFVADETVSGIILDVSSPGGMVYGAQELADKIFAARNRKPQGIIAVANPLMASGAYWVATAADRVVVTPSGDVGSVGVIAEHVDISKMYEERGAKITTFRSSNSPFKGEYSDSEPLSEEGKQYMQGRVDAIYDKFVGSLARHRGKSVEHINEHFGKGRVVDAKAAVAAGMADRVMTLQEVVGKMVAGRIRINSEKAQDQWDAPTRREQLREKAQAILATAETLEAV